MDVTTAQLYDILRELNVPKAKAQAALKKIVTEDELTQKFDALENRMMKRIYYAMLIQTGTIAAIVLGIVTAIA